MRIEKKMSIDAPIKEVWEFVSEPSNYRGFMAGITRWDVEGPIERGLGARYEMKMKIGSAEFGGLIEVVEFDEPYEIAWTGVTGIDQRGRWRLHERDGGGTNVTLRLGYHAEGGMAGLIPDLGLLRLIAERVARPLVAANLQSSLEAVKLRVEQRTPLGSR
jgi:carbon monoxide dehydrogenase subunit G